MTKKKKLLDKNMFVLLVNRGIVLVCVGLFWCWCCPVYLTIYLPQFKQTLRCLKKEAFVVFISSQTGFIFEETAAAITSVAPGHLSHITCSLCLCCDWLQGTSGPDPTTVYVDMRALRHDRYHSYSQLVIHNVPFAAQSRDIYTCVCVSGFGWWRGALLTVCH